jgi:trigger factor
MARISKFALAVVVALAASDSVNAFSSAKPAFCRHAVQLFAAAGISSKLNRLPESAVELTLNVPGGATQAAYDKACMELSKDLTIPGFRKGARIPPKVLEQAMASKQGGKNVLRVQAITTLLGELIGPALKDEHGLEPIGQPTLVVSADELAATFKPGQDLELLVKCDVWPDIQWVASDDGKPYFGLTGSYTRKPFNKEKMDKALNDLRERYATLEPAAEGSILSEGDACRVNMVGFMANADGTKGEPLPNAASGDDVEVIIGPGRYMEGLVEGLIGAKVGDTRDVRVTFPNVSILFSCCGSCLFR